VNGFCPFACLAIILSSANTPLFPQGSDSPSGGRKVSETSICDALEYPARFDGKVVKISAKYSGTWEGLWLSDGKCANQVGELDDANDVHRDTQWQVFNSAVKMLYTGLERQHREGSRWEIRLCNR